jgi:hypothetical protein
VHRLCALELLQDAFYDEHPASGDQVTEVLRQTLNLLARLELPPIDFGDLGD